MAFSPVLSFVPGEALGTPTAVKGATEGRRSEPLTARTFRDNQGGRKERATRCHDVNGILNNLRQSDSNATKRGGTMGDFLEDLKRQHTAGFAESLQPNPKNCPFTKEQLKRAYQQAVGVMYAYKDDRQQKVSMYIIFQDGRKACDTPLRS